MFLAWLRNLPADANLQQGLLGSQDRAESEAGPESDYGFAQGRLAGSPNMGTPAGSAWDSYWKDQARACRAPAKGLVNANRILPAVVLGRGRRETSTVVYRIPALPQRRRSCSGASLPRRSVRG